MSTRIHPSACVGPGASLGDACEIGPGAIIEDGATLGPRCIVHAHAFISRHVTLGEGNIVGQGAILGTDPQIVGFDTSTNGALAIGHRNTFREYCTIHRASKPGAATRIGDDNFFMVGTHIGHDCSLGSRIVIANNCLFAGHVEVHDQAVIGGGSVFHQFTRIGRLVMVRGASGIGKDIPPFCTAYDISKVAGLNVIGLRRAGLDAETRADLKRAYRLFFLGGFNRSQALERAASETWTPEASRFFEFIHQAGKRGVCTHAGQGSRKSEEEAA